MSGEYHKPDRVIIDDPAARNLDREAFDIGTLHDRTGLYASTTETPDCYDCGRQWADCTCEGPMS